MDFFLKPHIYTPVAKDLSEVAKLYAGVLYAQLCSTDLDKFYYAALLIAEHSGQFSQNELAELVGTDKVGVVRMVDHLSKKGYVTRQVDKEDRRKHLLVATPKASKALLAIKKNFHFSDSIAFEGFSEKEREIFLSQLDRMKNNLVKHPQLKFNLVLKKSKH